MMIIGAVNSHPAVASRPGSRHANLPEVVGVRAAGPDADHTCVARQLPERADVPFFWSRASMALGSPPLPRVASLELKADITGSKPGRLTGPWPYWPPAANAASSG